MAKEKISQGMVIAALLLNILIIPGLGTLIAGRKNPGITQLVLAIISIPLMFVLIGIPLLIGVWVWALVTSINLIKEAS